MCDVEINGSTVSLGPRSKRIIEATASLLVKKPGTVAICCAGVHPKTGANAAELMVKYLHELLSSHRVENDAATWTPLRPSEIIFRTIGEVRAFFDLFELLDAHADDRHITLYVAARWWHMPRVRRMLQVERRRRGHGTDKLTIRALYVWEFSDVIGMAKEPLAWVKNIRHLL